MCFKDICFVIFIYNGHIDKAKIIYIFTKDFNCSFIIKCLIKNGEGNRPADAVAAGYDLS